MICVAIALFACLIGQVYPEDADDKTKFMEAELKVSYLALLGLVFE